MIGNQDLNEEEPELKVTDKRKFNPDGSVRKGVVIEPEPVIPEPTPEPSSVLAADAPEAAAPDIPQQADDDIDMIGLEDDNPASFVNFLSTLVTNAAASLGAIPHPVTGQKSVDLDTGRYWIDVLQMLSDKTQNNLSAQESRLFESVLSDLKMQYVQLARATEEKLKAQAAKKFSSKDILGK